jgi:hypothetical protein
MTTLKQATATARAISTDSEGDGDNGGSYDDCGDHDGNAKMKARV